MKARHADPPNAAMDNDDARRNFILSRISLSLSLSLFFYIFPRLGDEMENPFRRFSLSPLLEKGNTKLK